ncbi:MAG: ABC transporter ATP-binding protein [Methanobacteriota archaeon]|nr:MAG: ABC transporter ATP-binding protein [Euryarchaeota archaeon]
MVEPLLAIEGLSIDYEVGSGTFHALTDVSLTLVPGRVVGIVGETGSGKSTLGHAIPRLLREPPARIRSGRIVFRGTDILQLPRWKLPLLRGTGIGMIFQEPINSLNPAYRIFDQVAEAVIVRKARESRALPNPIRAVEPHDYSQGKPVKTGSALLHPAIPSFLGGGSRIRREALRSEVLDYLKLVRINDPETILELYPHELSGGMRQRIMIAMALSAKPSLLIADEPTSALDITIQAQVLTLMKELMDEVRTSILFISHDLGVIAEMADEVGVLYAGHLVEFGPVEEVYAAPRHPYTKLLLRSVPNRYKTDGPLPALSGSVPSLAQIPPGCPFHPRCPLVRDVCEKDPGPVLQRAQGAASPTHHAACYFSEEVDTIA